MKFLLFTDLHIGEHSSYDKNENGILSSFKDIDNIVNQIIKIIDKENVNISVFLGDIIHNVNKINIPLLVYTKYVFEKIAKHSPLIIITGNHDQLSSSNSFYKVTSLFNNSKNIKVVDSVYQHYFSNNNFNLINVSYFRKEELSKLLMKLDNQNMINKQWKNVLLGHFLLADKDDEYLNQFGIDIYYNSIFDKFDKIYLGHIHRPYKFKNVTYIGSCIYHNFGDDIINNPFPLNAYIIDSNLNEKVYHLKSPFYFLNVDIKKYQIDNKYKILINTLLEKNKIYIKIIYKDKEDKKIINDLITHPNIKYAYVIKDMPKVTNIISKNTTLLHKTLNVFDYMLNYIKEDSSLTNKEKDEILKELKEMDEEC